MSKKLTSFFQNVLLHLIIYIRAMSNASWAMSCEFWLWRQEDAEPKAIRPFLSTVSQITDLGYDKRIFKMNVWKTRCRRRIAAGSWTRGIKVASSKRRLEDAERQPIRGLKSPSVFISPSFRRPWCMDRSYTTDLKVRGYLSSRLPDAFNLTRI